MLPRTIRRFNPALVTHLDPNIEIRKVGPVFVGIITTPTQQIIIPYDEESITPRNFVRLMRGVLRGSPAAIQDLRLLECIRLSRETLRQWEESKRQWEESKRQSQEAIRRSAEVIRESQEAIRRSAEVIRESQEAVREHREEREVDRLLEAAARRRETNRQMQGQSNNFIHRIFVFLKQCWQKIKSLFSPNAESPPPAAFAHGEDLAVHGDPARNRLSQLARLQRSFGIGNPQSVVRPAGSVFAELRRERAWVLDGILQRFRPRPFVLQSRADQAAVASAGLDSILRRRVFR